MKKNLLSLLLISIVGTPEIFAAMQRTYSAPARLATSTKVLVEGKSAQGTYVKDACENKLVRRKSSSTIETLQDAVIADNFDRFKELVGLDVSIDNAATLGSVSSTLAHCVVCAYTKKRACYNPEEDAESLINWFMVLMHLHVSFSEKDSERRTVKDLAVVKAKQYLADNAWRLKTMAPEEFEFVAMLKRIPALIDEAGDRYVSLTQKQRPDEELREYFGLAILGTYLGAV